VFLDRQGDRAAAGAQVDDQWPIAGLTRNLSA
jgi:hypothetical protein